MCGAQHPETDDDRTKITFALFTLNTSKTPPVNYLAQIKPVIQNIVHRLQIETLLHFRKRTVDEVCSTNYHHYL